MARRSPAEQLRKDMSASFAAVQNSLFWKTYAKYLQTQHDAALLAVRTHASGPEKDLRVAASLCSAFHTALSLPEMLTNGAVDLSTLLKTQEDKEGNDDAGTED